MTNTQRPALPWHGFLLGLLAFAFYSAGDVTVKMLSAQFDVLQIFALLQWIALPMLIVFIIYRGGVQALRSRKLPHQIGRGVLFTLQGLGAFYGFQHLPMANTYTFIFVMPIFTLIFAVLFLHEKVTRLQVMLMLVAFMGVLVVFRPGLDAINMAALIVLSSSMIGGLSSVWMRYLNQHDGFGPSLLYPIITGAILTALLAAPNWRPLTADIIPLFLLSGSITAVAHCLIVSAFFYAPASQVAPTQYSQIIWGVLYGYFFFSDVPDGFVIIGAIMIVLSGVWLARIEYQQNHAVAHG